MKAARGDLGEAKEDQEAMIDETRAMDMIPKKDLEAFGYGQFCF